LQKHHRKAAIKRANNYTGSLKTHRKKPPSIPGGFNFAYRFLFAHRSEVNGAGVIDVLSRQTWVSLQESAEVYNLVNNVARMATTHVASAAAVLRLDQVIDSFFVIRNTGALAILQEDPFEFVFSWIGDIDLVRNTSQERFVNQV
jgi:hypothetical protein